MNDSLLGRFFGVVARPRTWTNLLFNMLAFPLGLFYFVFFVTGLSVGLGLVIIWVGIPILLVVVGAWWLFAAFERLQAEYLLGADVAGSPRPWEDVEGIWGKIKAHFGSASTWKDLLYLLAKLAFGIVSFTVMVTLAAAEAWLVALPIAHFVDVHLITWGNGNGWTPPLWLALLGVPCRRPVGLREPARAQRLELGVRALGRAAAARPAGGARAGGARPAGAARLDVAAAARWLRAAASRRSRRSRCRRAAARAAAGARRPRRRRPPAPPAPAPACAARRRDVDETATRRPTDDRPGGTKMTTLRTSTILRPLLALAVGAFALVLLGTLVAGPARAAASPVGVDAHAARPARRDEGHDRPVRQRRVVPAGRARRRGRSPPAATSPSTAP